MHTEVLRAVLASALSFLLAYKGILYIWVVWIFFDRGSVLMIGIQEISLIWGCSVELGMAESSAVMAEGTGWETQLLAAQEGS